MRLAAPDRKKQLIDIAMKLFSKQGFDGTSTREIAKAAGISEAIIFRHFKTKEELYWAVLADRDESSGRNRRIREVLTSGDDFYEILVSIAKTLLDRTADDASFTRLLFYSVLRNRELSGRFFRTYAHENFELLSDFIRKGIEGGQFRAVQPGLAAQSFLGMIIYHYLVQELFEGGRYQRFSARELAEEIANLFLLGVVATEGKSSGPTAAHNRRALVALAK
jgi:AcrR family transcriptional regulator